MGYLLAIVALGLLCGAWALLQRWIAAIDPELGDARHCGAGCCSDKLCEIERRDPWRNRASTPGS